jgi:hypothetical protein
MSGASCFLTFEPKGWTKELIHELINVVPLPPESDDRRIMVESGKDDLRGHTGALFRILDGLPDRERERAWHSLYFVVRGAFHVGSSSMLAVVDGMRQLDERKTEMMRTAKAKRGRKPERDALIKVFLADLPKRIRDKVALPKINAALKAAGHEEISPRTLQRIRSPRHS